MSTLFRSNRGDEERLRRVIAADLDYVDHSEFATLSEAKARDRSQLESLYIEEVPTPPLRGKRFPAVPILSRDGESHLFRLMNWQKSRASLYREQLRTETPCLESLSECERLIRDAIRTRNRIAECNIRLVIATAQKYAENHNHFDELLSAGMPVLLNAIDNFDFGRGLRFSTYATISLIRQFRRIGREGFTRKQQPAFVRPQWLDRNPKEEQEPAGLNRQERKRLRDSLKRHLNDREQFVVCERFGLNKNREKRTFRELAEVLGVSKERVRQIQIVALRKLREHIDPNRFDVTLAP